MAEPAQPIPPICTRCGRFLRTAEERERAYCSRCPPLRQAQDKAPAAPPAQEEERFCCGSDPPCPSCPYVTGWD